MPTCATGSTRWRKTRPSSRRATRLFVTCLKGDSTRNGRAGPQTSRVREGRRVMVPSYPDRKTVAREFDCSESTVDEMVKRGVLPPPIKLSSGCVRWDWADIQRAIASLKPSKDGAV